MRVFDTLPPASPRQGYFRAISAWRDAALVEFGPEGTMHYAQSSLHGNTEALFTTGLEERHVIFGDTSALEGSVCQVDAECRPGLLFVTSSPVSEIIGVDIAQVCHQLQPRVHAQLQPWDRIPVEGHEWDGRRRAFQDAAAYLSRLPAAEDTARHGFFVLGLDRSDWNGLSDLHELGRMLETYFSLPCRNDTDGGYRLEDIPTAGLLLVADPNAQPLADAARTLWGIPSCQSLAYGLQACDELISSVAALMQVSPGSQWDRDRKEAQELLTDFRMSARMWTDKTVRLCLPPQQAARLDTFLHGEMLLSTCIPSEDEQWNTPPAGTVLLGNGILCSLYPETPSVCMAYPAIRQTRFAAHTPYMGIRGIENMLEVLHPCLTSL